MSGEFLRVTARTLIAQGNYTSLQYRFLRSNAANQCQIASNAVGSPSDMVGVLQNKPNSGQNASVGFAGVSKIICGSAVSVNRLITTTASGEATNATSGQFAAGIALGAGNNGETISAMIFQPPVQLTTNSYSV